MYRHEDPSSHIVLLSMEKPGSDKIFENDDDSANPQSWDACDWLKIYENIHHISGSPLHRKDLLRCNITSIKKAIVLCDPFQYEPGERLADSSACLALLNIEELCLNEDVFVTVEFVNDQNMKVLLLKFLPVYL